MPTAPPTKLSRYNTPVVGRLIAMPTSPTAQNAVNFLQQIVGLRGLTSFDFPSMPDVIELARSTDYYVGANPIMPDGIHQYRSTKPLEIPLSFKLHAMDQVFCPNGPLTLLQMAARLHSFVLPITVSGRSSEVLPVRNSELRNKSAAMMAASSSSSAASSNIAGGSLATDASVRTSPSSGESTGKSDDTTIATVSETGMQVWGMSKESGGVKPPVTCLLNLIWVAENQPGIACIGYVKDVRVRLMGPWLRGSNGEFNLPSMGEFEFTFMHHPGHGNNWGAPTVNTSQMFADTYIAEKHAYAHDVRDRLFNTRNLVQRLNTQGFESYQAPAGTGQPDAGYEPAPDINQDYMPGPYGNDVEPAVPVEAPRLGVPNSLKYGDPPNLPETSTVVMPVAVV